MAVDDSYTKLLLHMDGTDGSTTFTDEAGNIVTANGNAQIDTAQYVFGGASGLFDGFGDYLTVPDSYAWRLDTMATPGDADFTIDFWFKVDPAKGSQTFIEQGQDANNLWHLVLEVANGIRLRIINSGTISALLFPYTGLDYNWHHLALTRVASTSVYTVYIDGQSLGSQYFSTTMNNYAGNLYVGYDLRWTMHLQGWIDEIRVSKGIARWTSNFTPPTAEYGDYGSGSVLFRRGVDGIGRVGVRSVA